MKKFLENLIFEFSVHQIALFLFSAFFYILGAGIARYLGTFQNIPDFWYGFLFILLIYSSGFLLQRYFDPSQLKKANQSEDGITKSRQNFLIGLALLMVSSVIVYLLISFSKIETITIFFLVILLIFPFLFAIPPIRLVERGYGDLLLILCIAIINPALAFTIQYGSLHNLLLFISIPLCFFLLVMYISTGLKDYLQDMMRGDKNLVLMLGWKLAMTLHDWFIIIGYALLGFALLHGISWNLIWTTFVPLPVFIFAMYEIQRIRNGIKPRWALLTFCGYAGLGLMLYGLLFMLWFK
ncbi:MAG: hypothetical protein GYA12_08180 [Chloroflexi bacterium]|nr:hypothetical protein [Chloroflexota bacterium]